MTPTNEILDSIENRLRDLRDEIEALHAARAALDARDGASRTRSAAASSSRPARQPASRKRRSTRGRSTNVGSAGTLELLLTESGDLTTAALAQRTGGGRDQVLALLRELEAAGRIRRTGQRRGTRWHAITDEERIEARAAELAARSRRAA